MTFVERQMGDEPGGLRDVAGYVLAGGASRRFGSDKAAAVLGGETVLHRICRTLAEATEKVAIVGRQIEPGDSMFTRIADRWPREGPLGGIVTALLHSRGLQPSPEWNLVVSCDMPFLESGWLRYLANYSKQSASDAVIPLSGHGPEPLCGCYRTDAAERLNAAFASGTRKITDALQLVRLEMLDERHWRRFDSAGRLFWNMNTPANHEEARRIVEHE